MDHNYQNSTISHAKRVYRRLTLDEKFQLLEDAQNGMSHKELAEKYQMHRGSISKTLTNKKQLLKRKKIIEKYGTSTKIKKYSQVNESVFEKSIYIWFTQKRALGETVSRPLIQAVAKDFHKRFHGETNFSASDGWFEKFRKRHGIRSLSVKGKKGAKVSTEDDDATTFRTLLKDLVEIHGYELDNIYNADETTLFWKDMPSFKTEDPGQMVSKNRVVIQVCSNASGSHKIPLTVIGKSCQPQSLLNISLPVFYISQKKSRMDRKVFIDWYTNVFLPNVKEKNPNPDARFVLILDHAPAHPSQEQLNAIDAQCSVQYLPPNVTSLVQPMNQGIISSLKRRYRSSFIIELLAQDFSDKESVGNFLKKWTLRDCCYLLASAWSNVSVDTLKNAWKNLLQLYLADHEEQSSLIRMNRIPGCDHLLTLNEVEIVEDWVET